VKPARPNALVALPVQDRHRVPGDLLGVGHTASVTPIAPWVLGLEGLYSPEDRLIVRVRLKNPSR
jgi:hypothetical protein